MAIGNFHEKIFSMLPGMKLANNGVVDVSSEDGSVLLQIKNAYNTMNSSSRAYLNSEMDRFRQEGKTCYLIQIVSESKRRVDKNSGMIILNGKDAYAQFSHDNDFFTKLNMTIASYIRYKRHILKL